VGWGAWVWLFALLSSDLVGPVEPIVVLCIPVNPMMNVLGPFSISAQDA
jgi:hypothetical protein